MTRNEMKVLKMQMAMESAKATIEKAEYDMKVCQTRKDNATRRYNDAKEQLDKLTANAASQPEVDNVVSLTGN